MIYLLLMIMVQRGPEYRYELKTFKTVSYDHCEVLREYVEATIKNSTGVCVVERTNQELTYE